MALFYEKKNLEQLLLPIRLVYLPRTVTSHCLCSTDAILPAWASLLITAQLNPVTKQIVWGSLQDLEHQIFAKAIDELDLSSFESKPVIVKGCSEKQIPESAFVYLIQKLQPVVKSLFYGEACSSVPLFKK